MYKNGFLVDKNCDECSIIERIRAEIMAKSVVQNIVILTTTDCNARCYYCFEHGIEPLYMQEATAEAIIQYCKKNYKEKEIAITWFGGEPLLNWSIIKYITLGLIDAGYELVSHVTTNGSLVNQEILDFFKTYYKRTSFQITIDEIGEAYNKVKRYVDISSDLAFERTMNNVKLMISQGVILVIRVNFASSKIEEAKKVHKTLIKMLKGYDLSKVNIYMAPLSLDCDSEIISNFNGSIEHPFLQMVKEQKDTGFPLKGVTYDNNETELSDVSVYALRPTGISCGMTLPSRIVVNADGLLYKCHRLVGRKQYSVGNIFEGEDQNNETLRLFHEVKIVDEECRKCDILPICQSGCKYSRITYGDKQKCLGIKQVKAELVKMYYNSIKRK